ncbi:hypothetical protein [Egicoccus sp. AB-alg2]|uniref:hypothetical protein n=1 Tax=Egicoccus sp. AB-alg2 TaxID=3242693 RepID=UPI00359F0AF3
MDTVDLRAGVVARKQYGRATRRQLIKAAGVSRATITRRLEAKVWSEPLPGVIDLGSHQPSWRSQVAELVLAGGQEAWASHLTAGHLHRFLDLGRPEELDLLVLRPRRRSIGDHRVHTTRSLGADEITERHDIRCTTPARTLLDLAATTSPGTLERWIVDLARKDASILTDLRDLLDRHRAVPGRRRLLEVVLRLPDGVELVGSPLEVLGILEIQELGAPAFVVQYTVRDPSGARIKRVDVAWPELRVLLEFDGAAYHDLTDARAEDERIRDRLRALGWRVVVVRRADLGGHVLPELVRDLRRGA